MFFGIGGLILYPAYKKSFEPIFRRAKVLCGQSVWFLGFPLLLFQTMEMIFRFFGFRDPTQLGALFPAAYLTPCYKRRVDVEFR